MGRPVIAVIASSRDEGSCFAQQVAEESNLRAVATIIGALPVVVAAAPEITDVGSLIELADGILLSGSQSNVHPRCFGAEPLPIHEPFDERRDALVLPLIRACVDRAVPLLGICRGIQEMNVAFGGTLHPDLRELPGRLDHRTARLPTGEVHPDPDVVFADRHEVRFSEDGAFARLLGANAARVNSLHRQGILERGERVVVEGVATDGTIEAIRIADAPAFAFGVQWHAEYDPQHSPASLAMLAAFGAAAAAHRHRSRSARR